MGKLSGKVALVTGASKGIGAGIAKELAAQGASVVINYATSKQGADAVVKAITDARSKAMAIGGSVAKAADITAIFAEVKKQFGRLDILINNAGVYEFGPLEAVTEEKINWMFSTNVTGLLLTTQAASALFPTEGGSVINISSIVTTLAPPASVVYTASKGAVDSITRVLAKELGGRKIRVNAVSPGLVATEGVESAGSAAPISSVKPWPPLRSDASVSLTISPRWSPSSPLTTRVGSPAPSSKQAAASADCSWVTRKPTSQKRDVGRPHRGE